MPTPRPHVTTLINQEKSEDRRRGKRKFPVEEREVAEPQAWIWHTPQSRACSS